MNLYEPVRHLSVEVAAAEEEGGSAEDSMSVAAGVGAGVSSLVVVATAMLVLAFGL